jgi:adenine-specific DNA-methyltransferase
LGQYPQLKAYLEKHREALARRHVAQKNGRLWARTIDRVNSALTAKRKLYVADIKDRLNPVLDRGETYPHHNLYFVQSDGWDLEVLGGLLLSDVAQFERRI